MDKVPESAINRRRSTRVILKVPLVIQGLDRSGQPYTTLAATTMVSKHGARVSTDQQLVTGSEILVAVPKTGRKREARVVLAWEESPGVHECAIELANPENMWGVTFPPEDWAAEAGRDSAMRAGHGGTLKANTCRK